MTRNIPQGRRKLKVVSDPSLRPEEKETSWHLLGNARHIEVNSFHPTVIRGLLAQPEFEVSELFKRNIKGEEVVVGIAGKFPIASLKIGKARRDPHLSRVFSRRSGMRKAIVVCRSDTDHSAQSEEFSFPLPMTTPPTCEGF